MSIDIRQLTIGSHIAINGKRERVRGLDEDNGLIIRFPAEYVMASEVEPIPITPALLKELGFVEHGDKYTTRFIDPESDKRMDETKAPVIPTIGFYKTSLPVKPIMGNGWELYYLLDKMTVRYLHEAEAFLALHGVELIKD